MLLQAAAGALLACLLWYMLKWAWNVAFGCLAIVVFLVLLFPGALLLAGGFIFFAIGLLAAVGLLTLATLLRS